MCIDLTQIYFHLIGVDGKWSTWSNWGSCSKTCGGGTRLRSRSCDSPPPSGNGKDCAGSSTKTGQCNTNACCVDTYPRKYRCKTSVPCSRLRRKCNKTLKQALSKKCEKKLSKADLRKKVKVYCKKTCNSCNCK